MANRTDKRTAFGVKILNSNHKEIRRIKREGHVAELHGHKFWNSSFLIMDHLKKNPPKKRLKVLEIGCGWGLLGIYCATTFNARVTGIDADKNVLAFLAVHAEINKVKVEGKKMSFQQLSVEKLKGYDLIVGADVCYWDEMTNILFNLIGRAKKAGVKQIMISDPCRPPFTELVEKCNNKYPESKVEVVEKFLKRPVHASGEILIVS